jgi:hypothetical protein
MHQRVDEPVPRRPRFGFRSKHRQRMILQPLPVSVALALVQRQPELSDIARQERHHRAHRRLRAPNLQVVSRERRRQEDPLRRPVLGRDIPRTDPDDSTNATSAAHDLHVINVRAVNHDLAVRRRRLRPARESCSQRRISSGPSVSSPAHRTLRCRRTATPAPSGSGRDAYATALIRHQPSEPSSSYAEVGTASRAAVARANAMIKATTPSILSPAFALSGFTFPAGSIAHREIVDLPPQQRITAMPHQSA